MGLVEKLKKFFSGVDESQTSYLKGVAFDLKNSGYEKAYEVIESLSQRNEEKIGEYLYSIIPEKDIMQFFSDKKGKDYEILRESFLNYLQKEEIENLKYDFEVLLKEEGDSSEEFIEKTKKKFEEETKGD